MRKVHWIWPGILLVLLGVGVTAYLRSSKGAAMAELLPADAHGYAPQEPDRVFDRDTLFDYIDGGAEIYRSFNVRRVLARTYQKDGAPDVIVDLFDMGSSQDAFGAYHHEIRDGPSAGIGQGSELVEGSLAFWKGRYFVSIVAFDSTDESARAVEALGRAIAGGIREEGSPPELVGVLPRAGLLSDQVHYFHDHTCLQSHIRLASDNILKLNGQTHGVLARYRRADEGADAAASSPFALLLVRYPSRAHARAAHVAFRQGYLKQVDADGIAALDDSRFAAARLADDLIIGVLEVPSRELCQQFVTEVERTIGARRREKGTDR